MDRTAWLHEQFRRAGVQEGEILPWFCRLLAWIVMPDRMLRWAWYGRLYSPLKDSYMIEGVRIPRSMLLVLKRGGSIRIEHSGVFFAWESFDE